MHSGAIDVLDAEEADAQGAPRSAQRMPKALRIYCVFMYSSTRTHIVAYGRTRCSGCPRRCAGSSYASACVVQHADADAADALGAVLAVACAAYGCTTHSKHIFGCRRASCSSSSSCTAVYEPPPLLDVCNLVAAKEQG